MTCAYYGRQQARHRASAAHRRHASTVQATVRGRHAYSARTAGAAAGWWSLRNLDHQYDDAPAGWAPDPELWK